MTKTFRFGIIGAGVIAPTHADAISRLPNAELIAVADLDASKAQKLADKSQARVYTDAQTMLDNEQLDVVSVCTPSGLHGEHACMVMRAGSHVIVEKPMEITHARMEEMLQVQKQTGRQMAVISQHRFDESTMQVHQLLQQNAFGRLVLGNAAIPWWRSQAYYDSGDWRGTWALDGGGILMNQSIHSIDLLQWLMGPVKTIYAFADTLVHRMETEDVAVAVLRFASGALGTISATTGAYPGVSTRIEICGDQGSAIIENNRLAYLYHKGLEQGEVGQYGVSPQKIRDALKQEKQEANTASNPGALEASTHAMQIADLLKAIEEGSTPLLDGHAGRHPVEIILGVYESARTGKEVHLS
jgi:predicted dehydrogenase